jgi:hypothetical protein
VSINRSKNWAEKGEPENREETKKGRENAENQ